jgi:hypothetical protein
MSSHGFSNLSNIASSTSAKSFLRRTVGRLWVLTTIRLLKASSLGFRTNRFFECPKCRKWVRMAFPHLELSLHRIQKSRFLSRPEGRLLVPKPISLLRTSFKRVHQSLFFCVCSACRKFVRMSFRHHETSHHRIHQPRFLRRPEGILFVLRPISLLKTSLKRLHQCRLFRISGSRKYGRMAFRHVEKSFHRLHQSSF